jgi:carbon-monoxide dehydrogenase large subunit
MSATGIGAPVRRKEDFRFITGQGQYTDDVTRPGETRAVFVRSPHAHAKIKSIDVADAKKMPGVIDVLTGAQLATDKIGNLICGWMIHSKDGTPMKMSAHPALAATKVNCVGDAVAVVIAESIAQGKDAAEKVVVDYEVLPAVVDPAKAQAKGAPQIHPDIPNNTIYQWHLGDQKAVEAAFAAAKHVTKLDIVNNRLVPNAMEPRAALADYDAGTDNLTLWNTSQNPHVARLVISAFIGMAPEHKLRVIAPDVGGGFGSKIFIYPEEVVCLWASRKVKRPVKWTSDRSEAFLTDAHGRDHVTHAELALDANGKILALRAKTIANLGAYMSTFSSSVPTYLYATLLSGQYDIPQIYCEVDAVYTNTVPVDAYRGAGRPEATFVVERLVEVAARQMEIDPADLRRRNFITAFPHQTPVIMAYDGGDYNASLKKAMDMADVKGFAKRKREAARHGKLRGLGYSTYIEACGIAPSQAVGSLGAGVGLWESAEVRVNPTGSVEVLTGSHAHGQGHETTFAQLVSERLGIPIENVSIVHGDTDKVQFGMGTYGSRSGAVGMSAIHKALDKVEAKARKIAAHLMEADEADIVVENGELKVASARSGSRSAPGRAASLSIARAMSKTLKRRLSGGAWNSPSRNATRAASTPSSAAATRPARSTISAPARTSKVPARRMERSECEPPPERTTAVSPVTSRISSGRTPIWSASTWAKLVSWPWPVDWVPATASTVPSALTVTTTRSCGAPTGDST